MKELLPGLWQLGDVPPDGNCGAIYLVGEGNELALVDAGTAAGYPLLKQELAQAGLKPQSIKAVYVTHGHQDHYEGAVPLGRESDATVFVGQPDRQAVEIGDYWKTAGFYYGRHTLPLPETEPIGNDYEQRLGNVTLRAIETPGHTMGSVTYELVIPQANAIVALLGDIGWGGWHERIGSDLDAWKVSLERLRGRQYTHVSFGHCINTLVAAEPHLSQLQSEIGTYGNAYDTIPDQYFNETMATKADLNQVPIDLAPKAN